MLPRLSTSLLALALSSICLSASFIDVDEKQKAFLHQADGSVDESLGTIAALAPVIFEHDQDDPKKVVRFADFQVASEQVGLLKVAFCKDHHEKVTHAKIGVNGVQLVGMDEVKAAFGKKGPNGFDTPAVIMLPVKLLAGDNGLSIELKGKNDACVEVSVLAPASVGTTEALSPKVLLQDQNDPKKEVQFLPFEVAADRIGILKVECCPGHKFKIHYGKLTLNGAPVVENKHFNAAFPKPGKDNAEILLPIRIPAGSNLLGVELKGEKNAAVKISVLVPQTTPLLDPTVGNTSDTQLLVSGTALKPNGKIVVRGGASTVQTSSDNDGAFSLLVPLKLNKLNKLFVSEVLGTDLETPPLGLEVVQDSAPPEVFIDFPPADSELTDASITVAGRVSDLLSGFMGLEVKVNGIAATVNEGIGTNGTFEALNVPLNSPNSPTVITAVATDELGNQASTQITVTQVPLTGAQMSILSGNNQETTANSLLGSAIAVQVKRLNGSAFSGKVVTFEVIRSNGRLSKDGIGEGALRFQTVTDAQGIARAFWRLGSDAGCGNNRVEVTSRDINGSIFFCASATPNPPRQINIGSGNNQRGEAGRPAPERLRVWVSDACNGAKDVPVTFTVIEGTALLARPGSTDVPSSELTVITGTTGHAGVNVIPGAGNNLVEANFPINPTNGAAFNIFGVARDPSVPTSFTAVVLDNAEQPIQRATCTLTIAGVSLPSVLTDINGVARFDGVTAGGPAVFRANGLTANHVGGSPGRDIPQGSFPALAFETEIVPNAANTLPTPVLLPPLNPKNARIYDGTKDVELTVEGMDGIKMVIEAGSMRFASGAEPTPSNPAIVALNQVHFDKVPMPMPDGAAPPFAWTLQPAGATFDPPVQVTYPNMSGLPPGSIAYFLSFNHDTGKFEIVATGSVAADGSSIVSDPGSGIRVAGWGCNCPPYSVTGECENCNVEISGEPASPICQNEHITLSASGTPSGGTYSWSGGVAVSGQDTSSYKVRFSGHGEQTVSVTYTCEGSTSSDTVKIKVNEKSGKQWVPRFPTGRTTASLAQPFRSNVIKFITAMEAAGANVSISATRRPEKRAWLMHYSFRIGQKGLDPTTVPAKEGVDICWVHYGPDGTPDLAASKAAALSMTIKDGGYNIAFLPSLTSRHISGNAIDMTISWTGNLVIRNASNQNVTINTLPRSGSNTKLHEVGATYFVKKLVSDPPHWSDTGG